MANPQAKIIFTSRDIDYLCQHFNLSELRRELRNGQSQADIIHYQGIGDDGELFYWQDFCEACRLAIDILQSNQPAPKPVKGRIDFEAIKATNDIVAIVERYSTLRKAGKNFSGRCPIHTDKHPSLIIYPEQQSWYCFGCNRGGDVIAFIQAVEKVDFRGAAAILGVK